jgi:hypothetical protein
MAMVERIETVEIRVGLTQKEADKIHAALINSRLSGDGEVVKIIGLLADALRIPIEPQGVVQPNEIRPTKPWEQQ